MNNTASFFLCLTSLVDMIIAFMPTIIVTFVSLSIGGIITWFVSRRYYIRTALDLENETKKIRNLLRITLQALENSGTVKLRRDDSGQIIAMFHEGEITEQTGVSASLDVSAKDKNAD
jgi:hypothetical protein